ncbi:hypothetical protein ckrop_0597 [Corynebacterium kroppenstedtii DSM 44385]|uniref:Uncharacterized protein n=1 Tax=Corynebacterium kroppenstedtii (strain DSM 44385 / JCM 11950 / CIP 105744 / CCUG 35717) TaxID=645127 RepID=C4LHQ7_CORK4|nr:hypothetical protein ckrop_0597 [Corynebacterium kroppenstedtii DSM 44385]
MCADKHSSEMLAEKINSFYTIATTIKTLWILVELLAKSWGSRVAYPTGFHLPLTIVVVGSLLSSVTSTKSLSGVSSVRCLKWMSSIRYHVA